MTPEAVFPTPPPAPPAPAPPAPPLPVSPGRPTVGSVAETYYKALEPVAYADAANSYALLIFLEALGRQVQLVSDLVRDTPQGPGWSPIMDPDRCPLFALPWLGQMVGVTAFKRNAGELDVDYATRLRAQIKDEAGFRRGTKQSMIAAAQRTLTGAKVVLFNERDPTAYYLRVTTYTNQTPDPAATLAALISMKPAGILLTHNVYLGQDYGLLRSHKATYQLAKNDYPNYEDMRADQVI